MEPRGRLLFPPSCLQCGRFQLLSDFEGDRRSCRTKLNKHNERRRKAEAEGKAAKAAAKEAGYPSDAEDMRGGYSRKVPRAGARFAGRGSGVAAAPPQFSDMLQQLAADVELQRTVGGAWVVTASGLAADHCWSAARRSKVPGGTTTPPPPLPRCLSLCVWGGGSGRAVVAELHAHSLEGC